MTKSKPVLTVNKLGEYITASPSRKRRILQQLKYPQKSGYGTPPEYNIARQAIKEYFVNGFEESYIDDAMEELNNKTPNNDWHSAIIGSAILALETVRDYDYSNYSDWTFREYKGSNPKMNIKGVEISVNPDLIIEGSSRGQDYIGAFKIHISKSGKLTEEGGKYVSAVVYKFVEDEIIPDESDPVKEKFCLSFDVFTNSLVECPKNVVRRWDDIEAECQNIMAIWDSIPKP
jgi:hypothetical protein